MCTLLLSVRVICNSDVEENARSTPVSVLGLATFSDTADMT